MKYLIKIVDFLLMLTGFLILGSVLWFSFDNDHLTQTQVFKEQWVSITLGTISICAGLFLETKIDKEK